MDVQFYGANCIVFTGKDQRIVIDDNLKSLGAKSVSKNGDLLLFTGAHDGELPEDPTMIIDMPGEYEVANLSITGIPARAHMDEDEKSRNATMYKVVAGDTSYLIAGHVYPSLSEDKLESIGIIDVLFVPVGGNGYTLDPVGALKLIKAIEPKLVIPTHYADKGLNYEVPQQELSNAITELGMEQKERVAKLKLKAGDLPETTHLLVLERA
jgi:L-ascorbate metabolism protein UlaG (beta-lactamase superfamily)